MKTTNPPTRNSVSHVLLPITSHCSLITVLLLLALCCFAPCSALQAVSPAPDGAYPNGTTAEGQNALFSLTTGTKNTALGFEALYHNTTGSSNAAIASYALHSNTSGPSNTAAGVEALYHNTTG